MGLVSRSTMFVQFPGGGHAPRAGVVLLQLGVLVHVRVHEHAHSADVYVHRHRDTGIYVFV